MVFFIYVLLVVSDKQHKIGSSSRERKNHTATRNLSIQPHFGYANTTSLLNLTEQTLQRRNDKSRLFALSGCLRLPWLQQKNSFLEKTDRNGADWCFVDFKKRIRVLNKPDFGHPKRGEKTSFLLISVSSETDQSTISSVFFNHSCPVSRQRYYEAVQQRNNRS